VLVLLPHMVCNAARMRRYVLDCVMYVPCLWELCYCVSLAMRRVEFVKCAEGV